MHMNFAFTWPGLYKDETVGGDKIGFFANPAGPDGEQFAQLGGQGISVVSYSDKQDAALQYIKWFAKPDVQTKWWSLGGFSCLKAVVERPGLPQQPALREDFLTRWRSSRTSGPSRPSLAAPGHAEARS